jgi:hypothetical protein
MLHPFRFGFVAAHGPYHSSFGGHVQPQNKIPNPKPQIPMSQNTGDGKTATTVSGYWFLVTDNVFAPDSPDYPEYQKKSE